MSSSGGEGRIDKRLEHKGRLFQSGIANKAGGVDEVRIRERRDPSG
jgi:hypothetical protein